MLDAGDQVGVGYERQTAQCLIQVPRTYFTGSSGANHGLGEAKIFITLHTIFSFLCSIIPL